MQRNKGQGGLGESLFREVGKGGLEACKVGSVDPETLDNTSVRISCI